MLKISFPKVISEFALNQLKEAGLEVMLEKIKNRQQFSTLELTQLASIQSPALLATLARLVSPTINSPHLRFVFFLPIATLLEAHGQQNIISQCQKRLAEIDSKLNLNQPLYLAIDRWKGKFDLRELLSSINKLVSLNSLNHALIPLGPSTSELKRLLENSKEDLENLLEIFSQFQINSIEGGFDLEIHRNALELNFSNTISHPLSHYLNQNSWTQFINDLHNINLRFGFSPKFHTWFPWSPSLIREIEFNTAKISPEKFRSPLELLKSIALGRILLPKIKYIRAPLAIFGPALAEIALYFGANDHGYIAVDNFTANSLGLVKLSDTSFFQNNPSLFSMVA